VAFETEAYALLDTMKYITPDVYTLVIGEAMGNAAMLVASGKKGNRFMLPHARMMTCPPRMNRSFGSTVNMMIRAQDLIKHTFLLNPAQWELLAFTNCIYPPTCPPTPALGAGGYLNCCYFLRHSFTDGPHELCPLCLCI